MHYSATILLNVMYIHGPHLQNVIGLTLFNTFNKQFYLRQRARLFAERKAFDCILLTAEYNIFQ